MTRVAYYIDSHGFGHATRSMALAQALPADWEIILRTNAPAWLFEKEMGRGFKQVDNPFDMHPVHTIGYRVDLAKTREVVSTKLARWEELVEGEARWLQEEKIDLVLSDVSSLPIRAAKRAGRPRFGIGNFTWDWIFEPWFVDDGSAWVVTLLREMMAEATENFRLPFSDAETFPEGSTKTPILVRKTRLTRKEARKEFGFEEGVQYVLLTFGGMMSPTGALDRLSEYAPIQFVQVAPSASSDMPSLIQSKAPGNLWTLHNPNLHHPDLVLAADCLVTKPGYGILSEAMSTTTPMVLDKRPDFREYKTVHETLRSYPQVAFIEPSEMEDLAIGEALESVLAAEPKEWSGGTDGDQFIASAIQRFLEHPPE